MKQETNNEIDLLLRRLSRRQGVPVSDVNSDHLDADELNSYAENVLPAAARDRYTEHLAECSRCRELVVQLSGSVPVVAAKETLPTAAPSAFRKFLANLFSPMGLRYAVPALGLIITAAIGIMWLRSSEQAESYVAKLEKGPQSAPAVSQTPDSQTRIYDSTPKTAPNESAGKPATSGEKQEDVKTTSPVHTEPPAPATRSDRVDQQANEPDPRTAAQTGASVAPAPPAAAPKAEETPSDMRVEVEGRRPQVRGAAGAEVAKTRSFGAAKDEERQKLAAEEAKKDALQPAAQTKSGSQTALRDAERDKDSDDGVVRSVAGRRFRKQGGMWVDTAYDSGNAIVNVARGSEQYRALVADEPTIKTIADQLAGTIIVVWKSRTYRIR